MNYLAITHPLNGILILCIGIGVGILITHHYKMGWRIWWIGAFAFIFSQVLHIPFNLMCLNPFADKLMDFLPEAWHLPLISILLGLSAGLFEEITRYGVYRWWVKDARTWSQGLLLGAGHGGFEAIVIGVLSLYTYAQIVALRGVDLATIIPVEQLTLAEQQIEIYWSMPWYDSMIGALERVFAIPLHLAASLLVLQAIIRKRFRWVWLAIGLHTMVNAISVYLSQTHGIYVAEFSIGILAILDLTIIFLLRRSTPIVPVQQSFISQAPLHLKPIQELPETTENLDQTRYQ